MHSPVLRLHAAGEKFCARKDMKNLGCYNGHFGSLWTTLYVKYPLLFIITGLIMGSRVTFRLSGLLDFQVPCGSPTAPSPSQPDKVPFDISRLQVRGKQFGLIKHQLWHTSVADINRWCLLPFVCIHVVTTCHNHPPETPARISPYLYTSDLLQTMHLLPTRFMFIIPMTSWTPPEGSISMNTPVHESCRDYVYPSDFHGFWHH